MAWMRNLLRLRATSAAARKATHRTRIQVEKGLKFDVNLIEKYICRCSCATPKLCQDLHNHTGAPWSSWIQIVNLVDGVDLNSNPLHSSPTRSLMAALEFIGFTA